MGQALRARHDLPEYVVADLGINELEPGEVADGVRLECRIPRMRPSEVSGEAKMGEGRRVSVEGCQEFAHVGQTVVVFGSQRQRVEVR